MDTNLSAPLDYESKPSAPIPDFESSPYFSWLESVIQDIASEDPKAISIEVVLEDGTCSTRYYNCNRGDRALMMAAMEEAQIMNTIADYREEILAILNGEEDDVDEEDDPDSQPGMPDPSAPLGQ